MKDYSKLSTKEIIELNKERYDSYKNSFFYNELSHESAKNFKYSSKKFERDVIIPGMKRHHAKRRNDGTYYYQDELVRVEGSKDTGFIVISLSDGKVIHHTKVEGYSYDILIEDDSFSREKIKELLR